MGKENVFLCAVFHYVSFDWIDISTVKLLFVLHDRLGEGSL